MEELKNPKTVKEVFKDYNSNSFELSGAKVIGVNLYKRKSLLEVNIQSNKLIGILDILEFEKYMEKEPGITIEMVRNGYSNMQVSQKDVDEILKKYPDLDGIMTTSAVTALGLAEATEGREISIVSVDAQEDALKAVQDGRIVALGAQSGYQIGYETIRYIVNDLEGKRTGEDEILDSQVLTTENIDAYIKEDKYSSS